MEGKEKQEEDKGSDPAKKMQISSTLDYKWQFIEKKEN